MLKDGEKGAVLQRDKKTYAIVPHVSVGLISPAELRKIADVAEKHQAAIKLTSATRIAIVGLKEEDIDQAWQELGMKPGAAVGLCVRSIKSCPGNALCRLGQQDSLALARILDDRYHGVKLPGKFKIGVSGCLNQCAETSVKDLGFIGKTRGWTIMVGGNAASRPQLAEKLIENVNQAEALALADKVIECFSEHGKKGERLGRFIKRFGADEFKRAVLG